MCFSYKRYMLKPPLSIVEVLAEGFFINFLNFVTLKISTLIFATRCSPCNDISKKSLLDKALNYKFMISIIIYQ